MLEGLPAELLFHIANCERYLFSSISTILTPLQSLNRSTLSDYKPFPNASSNSAATISYGKS